ncbi:MAG: hypothetical protein J7L23_01835 [Candidatus Diapherotrites archaeon]|nr:hypothetical protein [Candidatus Diapherotrites archaeon]
MKRALTVLLIRGLDILKEHNFTGVFINHWASEPDDFGDSKDVEHVLRNR